MDFYTAVDELNSMTEHRFGSGPLGDRDAQGAKLRRKAFQLASKTYPNDPRLPAIKAAIYL